jgi:hypothetical protein
VVLTGIVFGFLYCLNSLRHNSPALVATLMCDMLKSEHAARAMFVTLRRAQHRLNSRTQHQVSPVERSKRQENGYTLNLLMHAQVYLTREGRIPVVQLCFLSRHVGTRQKTSFTRLEPPILQVLPVDDIS